MSDNATNARPAIEGWFTTDAENPALIGSRCTACGSYYFPLVLNRCRNPYCGSESLETSELSRRGKVWSVTSASYAPPKPFIVADPFVPFAIVAVELEREKMVVLGRVVDGVNARELRVGDVVEVTVEPGYQVEGVDQLIWKFRPVSNQSQQEGAQ